MKVVYWRLVALAIGVLSLVGVYYLFVWWVGTPQANCPPSECSSGAADVGLLPALGLFCVTIYCFLYAALGEKMNTGGPSERKERSLAAKYPALIMLVFGVGYVFWYLLGALLGVTVAWFVLSHIYLGWYYFQRTNGPHRKLIVSWV